MGMRRVSSRMVRGRWGLRMSLRVGWGVIWLGPGLIPSPWMIWLGSRLISGCGMICLGPRFIPGCWMIWRPAFSAGSGVGFVSSGGVILCRSSPDMGWVLRLRPCWLPGPIFRMRSGSWRVCRRRIPGVFMLNLFADVGRHGGRRMAAFAQGLRSGCSPGMSMILAYPLRAISAGLLPVARLYGQWSHVVLVA